MNIILIGSSTGGPNQLKFLLNDVDFSTTCVVIAQHMSPSFIPSFVRQFNQEALAEVLVISDGVALEKNKIFVCQKNTVLSGSLNLTLAESPEKTTFNPNVNLLFGSATPYTSSHNMLAILLTGMGDDGAAGLFELYKKGIRCLCENEKDSIVYGMPKRAFELNPRLRPMSLNEIKHEIIKFTQTQENKASQENQGEMT